MKRKFVDYFISKSKEDEVLRYGLESMYILLEKTSILFLITFILKITYEMIIFLFFFSILRSVAFGIHMNSSIKCTFVSIFSFILCTYLSTSDLNFCTTLALYTLCFLNIIKNAPANSKRNIDIKRYAQYCILITVIYGYLIFRFNFSTPLYALILESILISHLARRMKWAK